MTTAGSTAKEHIGTARKLAKACGVEVMGWNNKSGKEFISVQGDSDKLEKLRQELERAGWHAWPVAEGQQGQFMDFGMRPAPAGYVESQTAMQAVDLPAEPMTNSEYFHYRGPGGLYPSHLLGLTILLALIWMVRIKVVNLYVVERMGSWWLVIALILLLLEWVEIRGDERNLTIRKHFFRKRNVVPFSNIKHAKVIEQHQTRYGRVIKNGPATWFLTVSVRSGKSFDLFLSKQKLAYLAAFIKRRTAG